MSKPDDRVDLAFTASDGAEIANWVAYQIANGGYVPAIMIEIYQKLVKDLGLNEEGDDG